MSEPPPLRVVPAPTFAQSIRRARRQLDLTQAGLGTRLGVQQQTIATWESGKRPKPAHHQAIADFLGISIDDLVDLIDPPQASAVSRSSTTTSPTVSGSTVDQRAEALSAFLERIRQGPLSVAESELFERVFTAVGVPAPTPRSG